MLVQLSAGEVVPKIMHVLFDRVKSKAENIYFCKKKIPGLNIWKLKNPFYTTCHKYQSEQLVYQEFLILAKLKTYIFFYKPIFFSLFDPQVIYFTNETK